MAWTNPRYKEITGQDPPRPHDQAEGTSAVAPTPSGRLLVALPRQKRGGPAEELRVSLDEFNGHPYIAIRLWTQDPRSGAFWPSKRGCSVRLGEADDVAEALRAAVALADSPGGARPEEARAGGRPEQHQAERRPIRGGGDFDEFAGG